MQETVSLIAIVGALAAGTMSPGPSFVMVAREAVSMSRVHAVCAALGMGVGGALFAAAALAGLQAVFLAVPSVYLLLKVVGGAYLCYLGYRVWMAARLPLSVANGSGESRRRSVRKSFLVGLLTQLSNPKTAIVYASVFAALLPPCVLRSFRGRVGVKRFLAGSRLVRSCCIRSFRPGASQEIS